MEDYVPDIQKTISALECNNMNAMLVPDAAAALEAVRGLLTPGASVAAGGSTTLKQCDILKLLGSGDYRFFDRYDPNLDQDGVNEVVWQGKNVDFYLMSSNAITEMGELYNVDGRGNRVSSLAQGPKKVIIVAGVNKIVPDIAAAVERVRTVAAPLNAQRLGVKTPCAVTSRCGDCHSPQRICCHYLISSWQLKPGRITVILVNQPLGY